MSDYDFSELNDKEFEVLCADLIGDERGHRFERFKPGKDAGVDGRYFSPGGKEVVLQCKHWPNTPIEQLLTALETVESKKVTKLNPESYILAISKPLSRRDKKQLSAAFAPYIKRDDDVYGRQDLNDLLGARPLVLRRHTKLWLKNAEVLFSLLNHAIYGRSQFALEEMIAASRQYVRTSGHDLAVKIAEENGIVIIAGEPGIGKTTLAEQLCLEYVADGFSLFKIAENISEAEAVFRPDEKQVFYFDDFLGQNYLEAFRGNTGSHIVSFINRVAKTKRDKRFILTSRSTILNRGKFVLDSYGHQNIQRNEYVLTIASLTQMDRARILYNHIWFSSLPSEYVEEIYKNKRYRDIVAHNNYNPRLIQFITDHSRLKECSPAQYWSRIEQSLDNPSEVWENPFLSQLEANGRTLVLLVAVYGRAILEHSLGVAFARYLASAVPHLVGGVDFLGTLKQLTGSFLSRTILHQGHTYISLFNPSIGDYVLRRYSADAGELFMVIKSHRSIPPLSTLRSQLNEGIISNSLYSSIANDLLSDMCAERFKGFEAGYIAEVIDMNRRLPDSGSKRRDKLFTAIQALALEDPPIDSSTAAGVFTWAIDQNMLEGSVALAFILAASASDGHDEEELVALANLLKCADGDNPIWAEAQDALRKATVAWMADNVATLVAGTDTLADIDYEDYFSADRAVIKTVEEKFKEFVGINFSHEDAVSATDDFDAHEALDDLYSSGSGERGHTSSNVGKMLENFDDIDDLFERR